MSVETETRQRVSRGKTSQEIGGKAIAAKLALFDFEGKVIREWLLRESKCTIGSAPNCNIHCDLPGVAKQHALLVVGAQQVFLRSLAPNVSRNGEPINEILFEDETATFEIAGNRFGLLRAKQSRPKVRQAPAPHSRMQFTLARPGEIDRKRESTNNFFASSRPSNASANYSGGSFPHESSPEALAPDSTLNQTDAVRPDADWVADIIQNAIAPLESKIQSALQPITEERNRTENRTRRPRSVTQDALEAILLDRRPTAEDAVVEITPAKDQLQELVAKQSDAMSAISEQIVAINTQLSDLEQKITVDREQTATENQESDKAQNNAIDQLQNGMVSVSNAIQDLEERQQASREEDQIWRTSVQSQIGDLRNSVDNLINTSEKDRIEKDAVLEDHSKADASWKQDIHSQIGSLRESVDTLLHSSKEQPEIDLSPLQTQAEQNSVWKSEVHEQIGSLKDAVNQLIETASQTPAVSHTVDVDEELAWKQDVQTQFSLIRTALEQVAARHTVEPNALISEAARSPVENEGNSFESANNQAALQLATEHTRHLQSQWEDDQLTGAESVSEAPTASSTTDEPSSFHEASQDASEELTLAPEPHTLDAVENYAPADDDIEWPDTSTLPDNSESHDDEGSAELATELPAHATPNDEEPAPEPFEEPAQEVEEEFFFNAEEPAQESINAPAVDHLVSEQPFSEQPFSEKIASEQLDSNAPAVDEQYSAIPEQESEPESSGLPDWWDEDQQSESPASHGIDYGADGQPIAAGGLHPGLTDPGALADETLDSQMFSMEALAGIDENDQAPQPEDLRAQFAGLEVEEPFEPVALDEHEQDALHSRLDRLTPLREAGENEAELGVADSFAAPEETLTPPVPDIEVPEQSPVVDEDQPAAAAESAEDDSVEDYMRKLLARMRGVPEEDVQLPEETPPATQAPSSPSISSPGLSAAGTSPANAPSELESAAPMDSASLPQAAAEEPFDPATYVPRVAAPEQVQNLAEMRELANSSARTAIHKSTRKRHFSSVILKFVIAFVGLVVSGILVGINGFQVNIGLIATVAALLVAVIWGYDALSSIKPLLQRSLVLQPSNERDSDE